MSSGQRARRITSLKDSPEPSHSSACSNAGDGRRTFVFSYLPEDVGTGDYTLKIGLGESGGLAQSYALLRFRQGS